MRIEECIVGNEVIDASTAPALWDGIITADSVKERLLNQSLLDLLLRPQLDFTATALHGLIVLYGPPGTGKTTLAQGLAAKLAPNMSGRAVRRVDINPHGLMSAEHGQSQQRVSQLLTDHLPALADDGLPTVVVVDEVESMVVARSQASLAANPADVHRVTDAVLAAIDEAGRKHRHMLFVVTTNFTTALDDAFLSRSDAAILVPVPTRDALVAIVASTLLSLAPLAPRLGEMASSPRLGEVANAMEGVDGRRARKLVFEALAASVDTVLNPGSLTIDVLAATARRSANVVQGATDA